ncbi:hypothetical protein [Streptomyces sp. NPDC003483]
MTTPAGATLDPDSLLSSREHRLAVASTTPPKFAPQGACAGAQRKGACQYLDQQTMTEMGLFGRPQAPSRLVLWMQVTTKPAGLTDLDTKTRSPLR